MIRVRPRAFLQIFLTALSLACSRERSPSRVSGAAEAAEEGPRPPPPALSRFDVPLDFDFTPVLAVVERAVPRTFGSLATRHQLGDDTRKHYAYEATRSRFAVFVSGSEVHLRTTLEYRARGYYKPVIGPTVSAGCGKNDARPRIVVEVVTPLTLSSSWRLKSAPRIGRLAPASDSARDRCEVSILKIDVTERIVEAARKALTERLPEIDRKVEQIDLTERATGWWTLLNRPIRLADGVWLQLQPERLRLGRVIGAKRVLTVQAGMDAYPRIVTGPEPTADVEPLPPLAHDTTVTGFRVALEGRVDYATASRAITAALQGKTVSKVGRSATVQSIDASFEKGGKLALTVHFAGDTRGRLRLAGTPKYDAHTAQIFVPDLDYDLDTDKDMIDAYAWARSDTLRALLRARARVPVASELERGRTLLTSGLNRTIGGVLTLAATVDSVAVLGLYVTRAGLVVHAGASGNAKVSIQQKRAAPAKRA